ncbi:MAG: hypothetical protein FWD60_11120 [Candidatus Azobacteroides sp.]|nr:hypothetical protein [Candidatus Azobacteroides sp.]
MKTLQIDEKNALKLYKTASAEFKQMLEDIFGKDFFTGKITDRIKTYEDACTELGIELIDIQAMKSAGFTDDEITYRKIKTITEAINECWNPNWNNSNQKKWIPYFNTVSPSDFAFRDAGYCYARPNAGSTSRLCYKSEELATYAGKQFTELYKNFIL